MRRILVLINSLAPYGAENFVLNHVRFADRRRFDVTVAHMGGSKALADKFAAAGVEVVDVSGGGRRRYTPALPLRLARTLRARRIDLLQTHIGLSGVVGRTVGRALRVPVVSTEQTVRRDYAAWLRRANDLTFPLATRHVFISRAVVASFAEVFPAVARAPTIITNGIDSVAVGELARRSRAAKRAELGLDDDEPAFVNVGRLHPNKGQRYAIQALARVRAKHPRASLWIVGDGELRAELQGEVARAGVAGAVHFLGQRLDVHELLGAFDAYVHPALTEALGIAILEAMAAGLPTIASAVDGIPEFVHDRETGWLAPPEDVDALAAAMTGVLDDRAAAAAVAARGAAEIRAHHDVRASVTAYERVYDEVLGDRPARTEARA